MTKMAENWPKSIPYLWPKRLKNPTLWGRTYLYSPYKGVTPREQTASHMSLSFSPHPSPLTKSHLLQKVRRESFSIQFQNICPVSRRELHVAWNFTVLVVVIMIFQANSKILVFKVSLLLLVCSLYYFYYSYEFYRGSGGGQCFVKIRSEQWKKTVRFKFPSIAQTSRNASILMAGTK